MHPDIPNELLLHIFATLDDGASLLAVVLTCHRFRQLGVEQLVQTVVWKTEQKAENSLVFLENNTHLTRCTRSLAIHPEGAPGPWNTIWRPITNSFRNLNHLSLRHLTLSTGFYEFLDNAPQNLTHLAIDDCVVQDPPTWFASSADAAIPITQLSLGVNYPSPKQVHGGSGLFDLGLPCPTLAFLEQLPRLQSLTADLWVAVSQPPTALARLTSFTCTGAVVKLPFDVWRYLNQLLARAENLVDLEMSSSSAEPDFPRARVPPLATVSKMRTFVGPAYLATSIVRATPALASLVIAQPVVERPVDRVEGENLTLHGRSIGWRLVGWGEKVLRVIAWRQSKVSESNVPEDARGLCVEVM